MDRNKDGVVNDKNRYRYQSPDAQVFLGFSSQCFLDLGYNVGRLAAKGPALRLTATVQNVFVVSKYGGLDPEVAGGIDNNFYPNPRVLM